MISLLKCIACAKEYPLSDVRFTCTCGNLLDVIHDLGALKKQFGISRQYYSAKRATIQGQPTGGVWHFKELVLPSLADTDVISKQEGGTRLY